MLDLIFDFTSTVSRISVSAKEIKPNVIEEFRPAINAETSGLCDRNVFQVFKQVVPDVSNVLNSKFVLAVKNVGKPREKKKARLVALGHKDKLKDYILNDSPTLMKCALRLTIFFGCVFRTAALYKRCKPYLLTLKIPIQA